MSACQSAPFQRSARIDLRISPRANRKNAMALKFNQDALDATGAAERGFESEPGSGVGLLAEQTKPQAAAKTVAGA